MAQFTCCDVPESKMLYRWHTFANQTMHITCHCPVCGKYRGHVPQVTPYTNWVNGNYIPPTKPEKPTKTTAAATAKMDDAKSILSAILNIPDIDKYIGTILYNKARDIIK